MGPREGKREIQTRKTENGVGTTHTHTHTRRTTYLADNEIKLLWGGVREGRERREDIYLPKWQPASSMPRHLIFTKTKKFLKNKIKTNQ